ncbi:MAG: MoaD/ThiS family protein [Acidimicrobiales bacterium]
MPKLLLFAQARDVAGCRSADVEADTVGGVLKSAAARWPGLDAVIAVSAVWVNGEPADPEQAVAAGDEVAVLPPVSGG